MARTSVTLADDETNAVRDLLDRAFDGGFGDDDWQHALGGHHVVVRDGPIIVAHASVVPRRIRFADDERVVGYVEAVATSPGRERRGHGTAAMEVIHAVIADRYDIGLLSTGAHGFYERLGWQRWRGPTSVRLESGHVIPTPDEDDGIMVRIADGPAPVDLDVPITCDERTGDDW